MKIAGFQANSFVDYKGHIAAVVFVAGCNMRCWYCHNAQILDTDESFPTLTYNKISRYEN